MTNHPATGAKPKKRRGAKGRGPIAMIEVYKVLSAWPGRDTIFFTMDSEHLNSTGCVIKTTREKGRGVYGPSFFFNELVE